MHVLIDANFLLQYKRKPFLYNGPDPCAEILEPLSWLGTKKEQGCRTAPPGYGIGWRNRLLGSLKV